LEAAVTDIVMEDGFFHVAGSRRQVMDYARLGREALLRHRVPQDFPPGLEFTAWFDPPAVTFSAMVHAAVVTVNPATGECKVRNYAIAHDSGVVINPMIVEGQVVGAAVQGLGGALMEEIEYSPEGQILTTTLADYHMPTASDVPTIELRHLETRSPSSALGAKGVGEGGTVGPPAAIANAIADALGQQSLVSTLPLTPQRIWSIANGLSQDRER
jgi:carbon-monoxide dehydrogenase large subunit